MVGQESAVAQEQWPSLPQAGAWRQLTTGQPLGHVEGLFDKLDDATIAAEIAALQARASAQA